jgi:hypothetical protein
VEGASWDWGAAGASNGWFVDRRPCERWRGGSGGQRLYGVLFGAFVGGWVGEGRRAGAVDAGCFGPVAAVRTVKTIEGHIGGVRDAYSVAGLVFDGGPAP